MRNFDDREDQRRGLMFGGSVVGTVTIGSVLAVMAIYSFRAVQSRGRLFRMSRKSITWISRPPLLGQRLPRRHRPRHFRHRRRKSWRRGRSGAAFGGERNIPFR